MFYDLDKKPQSILRNATPNIAMAMDVVVSTTYIYVITETPIFVALGEILNGSLIIIAKETNYKSSEIVSSNHVTSRFRFVLIIGGKTQAFSLRKPMVDSIHRRGLSYDQFSKVTNN